VDWACLSWSSVGWDGDEEEEEEAIEQHGSLTEWDVESSCDEMGEQKTSSANPFCFAN
jgi:hypothetical protein